MILLDIAGVVVVTANAVFLQWRLRRFFTDRLAAADAAEEDRRVALYKQQKATAKAVAQSDRAVRKMSDEARRLQQDTTLLQRRVDSHFAHPAIKRLTGEEGEKRG